MGMKDKAQDDAAVSIPSAWDTPWTAIPTDDGNVPGPTLKLLRQDPVTGAMTFMTHLPPNWYDPELDWHPSSEEGYIIAGEVVLNDRRLTRGCYLYRPPGILHGPAGSPHDLGATIIQRTSGPLRILRYTGRKYPHRDLQPVTDDHLHSDVAWSEKTVSSSIRWRTVERGGWQGTRAKWLHRNRRTGGGLVMLRIPAGWAGLGSPARGPVEEFVLDGELEVGDVRYGKWGYSYRPAGVSAGGYASAAGATCLMWWNGADEF
jgi:hypothetical protein